MNCLEKCESVWWCIIKSRCAFLKWDDSLFDEFVLASNTKKERWHVIQVFNIAFVIKILSFLGYKFYEVWS